MFVSTNKTNDMNKEQLTNEIKSVKKVMSSLMDCIKDNDLDINSRNQYYKEYKQSAAYYLMLNQELNK